MTNLEQLFVMLGGVAGSTALWKFFETRLKIRTEQKQKMMDSSDSSLYRDDMKARIEKMSLDLEEANDKILALIEEVSILKTENKFLKREIERLKEK